MKTQTQIDADKKVREATVNSLTAKLHEADPGAKLSFHYMGPAEWYEVHSGSGVLLADADASTVFDGDATALRMALKKLGVSL